jgi:hypothetical protein
MHLVVSPCHTLVVLLELDPWSHAGDARVPVVAISIVHGAPALFFGVPHLCWPHLAQPNMPGVMAEEPRACQLVVYLHGMRLFLWPIADPHMNTVPLALSCDCVLLVASRHHQQLCAARAQVTLEDAGFQEAPSTECTECNAVQQESR